MTAQKDMLDDLMAKAIQENSFLLLWAAREIERLRAGPSIRCAECRALNAERDRRFGR